MLDAIVRQFQANWFTKRSMVETRNDVPNGEQINANHGPTYVPMSIHQLLDVFRKVTVHNRTNKNRHDFLLADKGFSQARRSYLNFSKI